jgi:hypothetical protein
MTRIRLALVAASAMLVAACGEHRREDEERERPDRV